MRWTDGRTSNSSVCTPSACLLVLDLAAQVAVANVVFALYAWLGHDFAVPAETMIAYLSATVIEVIGVVAIVTRYLFPNRDSGGS